MVTIVAPVMQGGTLKFLNVSRLVFYSAACMHQDIKKEKDESFSQSRGRSRCVHGVMIYYIDA